LNKKSNLKQLIPYLLIPVLLVSMIVFYTRSNPVKKVAYSEIVSLFENDEIKSADFNLNSGALTYYTRSEPDTEQKYTVPAPAYFYEEIYSEATKRNAKLPEDQKILLDVEESKTSSWILSLLPTVVLIGLMVAGLLYMSRKTNQALMNESNRAISFGKARVTNAKDSKRKTTFADVAGADEEKAELAEIVDFLREPLKFNDLGARIPKGVLLVGPPGTGKTLLARAVAGEANVPFFSISGSDFVEMYVGVGASRVRDLFETAKKNSPSIIFIDEIDAVGRHRGAGMGGGHDEREQTLNQLLVEMDGFGVNEGVIIIAATNRPDILDPALLRPGRFDRQVTVGYPDVKGREEILKVHARGKPLGPDVDLQSIARSTVGFTGADLENLLNESALLAARRSLKAITMKEIDESTIKVIVGTEKKSHKRTQKDKQITAYHEAGHAVTTFFLPSQDPVYQVSIIPRGMAAGFTMSMPQEDKQHMPKSEMLESIEVLLSGRAAEAIVFGDICTGASNDIERATETARNMVTKYGMSDELGPIAFGTGHDEVFLGKDYGNVRNYSETVASKIDAEVEKIVSTAYEKALALLKEHLNKLKNVAEYLIVHEKMDGDKFKELMQFDHLITDFS
jgi:cell division protease FtsH